MAAVTKYPPEITERNVDDLYRQHATIKLRSKVVVIVGYEVVGYANRKIAIEQEVAEFLEDEDANRFIESCSKSLPPFQMMLKRMKQTR